MLLSCQTSGNYKLREMLNRTKLTRNIPDTAWGGVMEMFKILSGWCWGIVQYPGGYLPAVCVAVLHGWRRVGEIAGTVGRPGRSVGGSILGLQAHNLGPASEQHWKITLKITGMIASCLPDWNRAPEDVPTIRAKRGSDSLWMATLICDPPSLSVKTYVLPVMYLYPRAFLGRWALQIMNPGAGWGYEHHYGEP